MGTYRVATRVETLLVLLGFGLCMVAVAGCGGGGGGRDTVATDPMVEDLVPGPGLSAGNATPVVASTDADTLQSLRDNPGNVFPALNAMLYRATTPGLEGTRLSTDFAVNSIQMNAAGDYVIRYTLEGTPGTVTMTANDLHRENRYRIDVDGIRFDFWFKTETRNEPFSRYMDSAYLGRDSATGQHRAWFIFGARTRAVPPTGSATYRGRLEARAYRADNPDHDERQHITGAMRLVANFDLSQLQGTIDAIRNTNDAGTRTDWPTSSFEITDGRIANGQFTATLLGKDSDPNASFDESLKDFTGSILGEFYGPDADEIGAVVAAERTTVDTEYGRSLYGYVVGKNIEPFTDEARATGLHPLSGRVFGTGTKALIVMAHGTVSSGGPSDYMYRHAEDISRRLPDATVVAVLYSGYYDREGRVSPGSNHERFDFNTPANNRLLAMTIQNLRGQISPEYVIAVGHSAGAREFGVIIGKPEAEGLVDGAVLLGGRFRQGSRILSEIPLDFVNTVDRSVKVVAVTGTHDSSVPPEESQNYVRRLRELGVDADLVLVKGAEHSYSRGLHDAVVSAIGGILNKLEPGLGDTLVDDRRPDPSALMTGVHRDWAANTTTLSNLERPTVESTDDGFRITYVLDGQTQTVELSGDDFGADPGSPTAYSKTTDGTEFRLWVNLKEFEHLDISTWGIYSDSSSDFGSIIYGARTTDMPTSGSAEYSGTMRAIEWPADAAVSNRSSQVTRFRGELSLTADFGNASVLGNVTGLESRPGDGNSYQQASGGLGFNGTIAGNGISATNLSGSGVLAHYSNGSVTGAFYGPGASEVGGVFEATDTTSNKLLTGGFAGDAQ